MAGQPLSRRDDDRPPAPGASGRPAQPYEEGNLVALRHGAYSPRMVEPLAREIVTGLLELATDGSVPHLAYLAEPQHAHAVWAWARAEAQCQLLNEYLFDKTMTILRDAELVMLDAAGEVKPAAVHLERVERRAMKLRERLGLDPRAESELARSRASAQLVGFDLAAVVKAGGEAIDAQSSESGDTAGITHDEELDDEEVEDL